MTPTLGNKPLSRIGYGTMRLPGIRGVPADSELACRILREAVALGTNVIDTADYYGSMLANRLIADALSPYPEHLIIATKVGVKDSAGGRPEPAATPEEIRKSVDRNLQSLRTSSLELVFLRLPGGPLGDSGVPVEQSVECLAELQAEGVVEHIGLSSATVDQIETARSVAPVEAVQNAMFLGHTESNDVLRKCTAESIPFFAYFPLGMGRLIQRTAGLEEIARVHGVSESQIALAWLLAVSPMTVPIPGTSRLEHLRENLATANLDLSPSEIDRLGTLA